MPELPEVESARRLAEKHLVGKRILNVKVVDDRIVFDGVLADSFAKQLKGRTIKASRRFGKQLWFDLDGPPHPTFHLGMTGTFQVKGQSIVKYVRQKDEMGVWPPRFWKVQFEMADGTMFAFTNARRFGRIRLLQDPANEHPVSTMGFDPFLKMPPLNVFSEKLLSRKAPVKAVLLDQSFAAGVGNWVADEVLYQSRVHPEERSDRLNAPAVRALRQSLLSVVRTACQVNADSKKFPRAWLFHYRWDKGNSVKEKLQDGKGRPLRFLTVGGRTSAFVPQLQRLSSTSSNTALKRTKSQKKMVLTKRKIPAVRKAMKKH